MRLPLWVQLVMVFLGPWGSLGDEEKPDSMTGSQLSSDVENSPILIPLDDKKPDQSAAGLVVLLTAEPIPTIPPTSSQVHVESSDPIPLSNKKRESDVVIADAKNVQLSQVHVESSDPIQAIPLSNKERESDVVIADAQNVQQVQVESSDPLTFSNKKRESDLVIADAQNVKPSQVQVESSDPIPLSNKKSEKDVVIADAQNVQQVQVESSEPLTLSNKKSESDVVIADAQNVQPSQVQVESSDPLPLSNKKSESDVVIADAQNVQPSQVQVESSDPLPLSNKKSESNVVIADAQNVQPSQVQVESSDPLPLSNKKSESNVVIADAQNVQPSHVQPSQGVESSNPLPLSNRKRESGGFNAKNVHPKRAPNPSVVAAKLKENLELIDRVRKNTPQRQHQEPQSSTLAPSKRQNRMGSSESSEFYGGSGPLASSFKMSSNGEASQKQVRRLTLTHEEFTHMLSQLLKENKMYNRMYSGGGGGNIYQEELRQMSSYDQGRMQHESVQTGLPSNPTFQQQKGNLDEDENPELVSEAIDDLKEQGFQFENSRNGDDSVFITVPLNKLNKLKPQQQDQNQANFLTPPTKRPAVDFPTVATKKQGKLQKQQQQQTGVVPAPLAILPLNPTLPAIPVQQPAANPVNSDVPVISVLAVKPIQTINPEMAVVPALPAKPIQTVAPDMPAVVPVLPVNLNQPSNSGIPNVPGVPGVPVIQTLPGISALPVNAGNAEVPGIPKMPDFQSLINNLLPVPSNEFPIPQNTSASKVPVVAPISCPTLAQFLAGSTQVWNGITNAGGLQAGLNIFFNAASKVINTLTQCAKIILGELGALFYQGIVDKMTNKQDNKMDISESSLSKNLKTMEGRSRYGERSFKRNPNAIKFLDKVKRNKKEIGSGGGSSPEDNLDERVDEREQVEPQTAAAVIADPGSVRGRKEAVIKVQDNSEELLKSDIVEPGMY